MNVVDQHSPWLGLASFTEETRSYFHGRDEEVAELGRRVQRKLLTVLFGQSGLGKTSILRAGLVPRLRREGYCPIYLRLDHTAGSPPLAEQIKQAVFHGTTAIGRWTKPGIAASGETLWEYLHHRDDVLQDASGRVLVPLLIFDQFEEIFTLAGTDAGGRARVQGFLTELADLVENRPPATLDARIEREEVDAGCFDFTRADYRVLITLREDYLPHLEGLKSAMPSITQNRVRLARMNGHAALEAVLKPGAELVTEDVARAIVLFVSGAADLAGAEVEPSLLSLVCRELNESRRLRGLPVISADLLAGSRETILSEFYERSLKGEPIGVRRFIEDELLTDSGYRESIAEERARKAFAAAGARADLLPVLVDRRLLRVEERLDVRRVELTHDVLCSVVAASRAARREREIKEAAESQLAATRAKEAATRRELLRARLIAAVCAVLLLLAAGAAVVALLSQRRAREAERAALSAAEASRVSQQRALMAAEEARRAEAQAEAARKSEVELRGLAENRLRSELASRQEAERQRQLAERQKQLAEQATAVAERDRARAQAAEKSAETEAAVSLAVNNFLLNDLLAQASPDREPDRDITLRAVLDRAAQNIEGRFHGQPRVEASIRSTLASTYLSLGEFSQAQRHLEHTVDLYRGLGEGESPAALFVRGRLVDVLRHVGKLQEAEKLGLEIVAAKRRVLGPEHQSTLGSMLTLCQVYRALGNMEEAERINAETLEIQRRSSGESHPSTLASKHSLSLILTQNGKYAEAEKLLKETYESYLTLNGPDHPNTIGAMGNLARVYQGMRKLDQAASMLEEVLARQTRVLGERHPATMGTKFQLGSIKSDQGNLAEAEVIFSETVEAQRQLFGPDHPNVAAALGALAEVLRGLGRLEEAEARQREGLALDRKRFGNDSMRIVTSLSQLGQILLDRKQPVLAMETFGEAQRIAERVEPGGWQRYAMQVLVARSLIAQKKTTEVVGILTEALMGLGRTNGPASWQAEATRLFGAGSRTESSATPANATPGVKTPKPTPATSTQQKK